MDIEELHWKLCRAFNEDFNSKIKIYEYCLRPENRPDIKYLEDYMPEITDMNQYNEGEEYVIVFVNINLKDIFYHILPMDLINELEKYV